ncbi:hypothetical protein P8452_47146 [Trifolium repens]|nr:hypothetical protein P8452_47146 [Trifolium repens]
MLIWRFQLATLTQLRNIFGLGIREAEEITIDVTSKVYCKHLAKAFSGGKIRRFQIRILFAKVKFHLMHIVNIGLSPSKKMSQRQKGMHHIGIDTYNWHDNFDSIYATNLEYKWSLAN